MHRSACAFLLLSMHLAAPARAEDPYPDFYKGDAGVPKDASKFINAIQVTEPAYRAEVQGDVKISFQAPGMQEAKAFCWQQPTSSKPGKWGQDVEVASLKLDDAGKGSFVFPANKFPNGPLTIRIQARNREKQDICELQLFNQGGEIWKQGIPRENPPGAKGLDLLFSDDFEGPLSISRDGQNARYVCHKSGGGDFSGWPFGMLDDGRPFEQVGTWLRIAARKDAESPKGRSGILSSLRQDGTGFQTGLPAYFECRLIAQSAPGTWPAFWTLTRGAVGTDPNDPKYAELRKSSDEHDILEAYGGYGHKNPNGGGLYHSVTHFWGQDQTKPDWYDKENSKGKPNPKYKPHSFRTDSMTIGGKSSWSWTFHTYGMAINEKETTYYFDDIEIGRHPTGALSKVQPHWFLINYAIGGISGWQIDLERYGNGSDMYVDYVRVYGKKP